MTGTIETALWYAGRGTGVVALVLLTLSVAGGVGTRAARPLFGLPRFAVNQVHRNASLLGVAFLAVHILTLLLDPQAQLRLLDVIIPFGGAYRPLWLGLGTIGFDLMIAITVTSLLRLRIGRRTWRAVHWLSYLSWPVALAHTLGDGTDNGTVWLWAVAVLCTGTVLAAVCWRCSDSFATATAHLGPRWTEEGRQFDARIEPVRARTGGHR